MAGRAKQATKAGPAKQAKSAAKAVIKAKATTKATTKAKPAAKVATQAVAKAKGTTKAKPAAKAATKAVTKAKPAAKVVAPAPDEVRPATMVDGTPLPFEIRRSAIQGRGAFATRRLRKGQRLAEYEGEHITQAEADRRYAEAGMKRHHTFLFTLDEDEVIDGRRGGNDSRFINHSCEPNCEAWIEDGRIYIHALETIQPGAELLYDYKYERTDAHTAEDEKFYACRCGTPSCRGTILAPRKRGRGKKAGAKGA